MSRFRLALLSLIALVGLSTACIQAETAIVVNDDGSGTVSLTQALDTVAVKDLLKDFGEGLGGDMSTSSTPSFDPKDIDTSKLPKGTKVEPYKQGNFEGVKLTAPFDKPENAFDVLNKLSGALSDQTSSLTGMAGAPSGASSSPGQFETMTIGRQGDGWKFEAKLAASGVPAGLDADTKELVDSLLADASVTLKVKLPGKVAETNADSTSNNNEMTWKLPLVVETPKTLTGRTTR